MERIRQLRNEKGLSQAKLAVRADMDPATLNRLEQGKGNPNLKTLERVAEALGVEVTDLLGKASRRSSPEPSLFNGLEDGRRDSMYGPWLEFVDRYAARWEQRIETGDFDLGSFNEFVRVIEELVPVLKDLNTRELREFPVEISDTFGGRDALTGKAIWRLLDLLDPMAQAGGTKFANSELEQLRHKRESLEEWGRAASG
jgi:transcriptional regulator with XRE-family HTH domain